MKHRLLNKNFPIFTLFVSLSVSLATQSTLAQVSGAANGCTIEAALGALDINHSPLYQQGPRSFALPGTIQAMQNLLRPDLGNALLASAEWQGLMRHRLITGLAAQDDCLRRILNTGSALVEFLLRIPSGVHEGYTVGEHSGRVLEAFHRRRATLTEPGANILEDDLQFFETLLLLHDIGKGFSALTQRDDLEVEFSMPIAYRVLLALGFSPQKAALGRELIRYHKLLGGITQGINRDFEEARRLTERGAAQSGTTSEAFYIYLENLFIADASSYPGVMRSSFQSYPGGLFPRAHEFFDFRGLILGERDVGNEVEQPRESGSSSAAERMDDAGVGRIVDCGQTAPSPSIRPQIPVNQPIRAPRVIPRAAPPATVWGRFCRGVSGVFNWCVREIAP